MGATGRMLALAVCLLLSFLSVADAQSAGGVGFLALGGPARGVMVASALPGLSRAAAIPLGGARVRWRSRTCAATIFPADCLGGAPS